VTALLASCYNNQFHCIDTILWICSRVFLSISPPTEKISNSDCMLLASLCGLRNKRGRLCLYVVCLCIVPCQNIYQCFKRSHAKAHIVNCASQQLVRTRKHRFKIIPVCLSRCRQLSSVRQPNAATAEERLTNGVTYRAMINAATSSQGAM
jgi:hypothetical protein